MQSINIRILGKNVLSECENSYDEMSLAIKTRFDPVKDLISWF
jgi:hypothetical protein